MKTTLFRKVLFITILITSFQVLCEVKEKTNSKFLGDEFSESSWYMNEEKRSRELISSRKCDVVVLPLRTEKLDFIERSLFSKILSLQITINTNYTVLDPELTGKALRSDQRLPIESDYVSLAKLCDAKFIVVADAEIIKPNTLVNNIMLLDGNGEKLHAFKNEKKFSHTNLPYANFRDVAKELITLLPTEKNKQKLNVGQIPGIPKNLADLIILGDKSLLGAVFQLQFVASLFQGPAYSRKSEDLYERALALSLLLPKNNKWRNLAIARSLTYLHRRPAALAMLSNAKIPEEIVLVEFLNGNLSSIEPLINSIDSPLLKFMSEQERQYLLASYSKKNDQHTIESLVENQGTWTYPLYFSLTAHSRSYDSNMYVKNWLDMVFPIEARDLETRLKSYEEIGKVLSENEFFKWAQEHIDETNQLSKETLLNQKKYYLGISEKDVLSLASHMLFTNILKSIRNSSSEYAANIIKKYEGYYIDHPQFSIDKGWNVVDQSEGLAEPYQSNLKKQGFDILRKAAYWGRFQRLSGPVWPVFGLSLMDDNGGSNLNDDRYDQLLFFPPRNDRWLRANNSDRKTALEDCLHYSVSNFQCLLELSGHLETRQENSSENEKLAEQLFIDNQHRFNGYDRKFEIMAHKMRETGDFESFESLLRLAIENNYADWFPYYELGTMLQERGEFTQAAQTYLKYPGFYSETASRVENSGNANIAASNLYWAGAYEQAIPLFEIAVKTEAGAASTYSAQYKLALINGEYEQALTAAREWVRRYGSKYAYRNLIQMHFILGNDDKAESIFDLAVSENYPQPWVGMFVGRGKFSSDQLVAWSKVSHRKSAKIDHSHMPINLAQRFIFITHIIDRLPNENISSILSEFDQVPNLRKIDRGIAPLPYEELKQRLLGEGYPERYTQELTDLGLIKKITPLMPGDHTDLELLEQHQKKFMSTIEENRNKALSEEIISKFIDYRFPVVENIYSMLSSGLRNLYLSKYDKSYEQLQEANKYHDMREFIPYLAYVALKVGKTKDIDDYLDSKQKYLESHDRGTIHYTRKHRFEYYLINAFIEADRNNHEAALKYLKSAAYAQPYVEQRSMFPMYQVVEAAEFLYYDSKYQSYKDFALDLARRNTVIQPMYAWSYAVVATYTDDPVEKMDSLMKAIKLDSKSWRVSQLPEELINKAKDKLKNHDPFKKAPETGQEI